MVLVLADHDLSDQARRGNALGDRPRRQIRRRDPGLFVRLAGVLDADDFAHLQDRGLIVEFFSDRLADRLHRLVAARAHPLILGQLDHGAHAWQVGSLPTDAASAGLLVLALGLLVVRRFVDVRRRWRRIGFDSKRQLALAWLIGDALAAATVDHSSELGDESLQLLIGCDELRDLALELADARAQQRRVLGKWLARRHCALYARHRGHWVFSFN